MTGGMAGICGGGGGGSCSGPAYEMAIGKVDAGRGCGGRGKDWTVTAAGDR